MRIQDHLVKVVDDIEVTLESRSVTYIKLSISIRNLNADAVEINSLEGWLRAHTSALLTSGVERVFYREESRYNIRGSRLETTEDKGLKV